MCAEPWKPQKGEYLLDRYDIIKKLGEGAWGTVYLAYDMKWNVKGGPVAIKHLRPEIVRSNPRAIERFKHELKIIMSDLRGLTHIVRVYDFDSIDEENFFYIMDYIEGGSLRDLLDEQGAFPILDAIDMALDICGALETIHERNVIHNDLKPDNILMPEEKTKRFVMISDFGSASLKGSMGGVGTGMTGPRTLYYSSPELLKEEPIDERSDLYAVGVMLYKMIVGEVPFLYEEGVDLVSRILNDPPTVPSSKRKSVSSALDEVILKALKKRPDERYSSADEMMSALREVREVEVQRHKEKQELYKGGVSYLNTEIWQAAIECFEKVKTLDPNYKDVAQLLEKARRQGGLEARYARAKTSIKCAEWKTAIIELEEIIRIEENYRDAKALLEEAKRQHKLAELYEEAIRCEQNGEWVTARDLYLEIVSIDPQYKEVLDKVAEAAKRIKLEDMHREVDEHLLEGELEEAIRILEGILRIEPDHPEAVRRLQEVKWQKEMWTSYTKGMRYLRDKPLDLAIKYFEEVAYCIPVSSDENILGTDLDSLLEEALSNVPIYVLASVRLVQAKKLKIAILHQEAETLRQQGDKQGELEKLKDLYRAVPTDEKVNARITELQKAIDLETYYAQGKQAYSEGRWEAAEEALVIVVDIDKSYLDANSMLLDAQRRQELQKLFDESEELIASKQWPTAWETLRRIHRQKHYQDVIAKEKLFTRMFFVLGSQHAEAEEWYQAKQRFAKVVEYSPDYRDAKKQLDIARSNNLLKRNYHIKRSLGPGRISRVDCAEDIIRQREVSLKYLTASSVIEQGDAISRRFRIQAKRCKKLKHKNIVTVFDVEMRGVVEDRSSQEVDVPVVVMEYIEGRNLAKFATETKVSEMQAIELTSQLCWALQYAHEECNILHLDIKPSNILVQADGQLKLTDFDHTSHGTMGYRPPEQVRRSAELDERADIFAAGKVLCALLTGKLPVEDPLDENDPSFQEIAPPLQDVIRKATASNPADRYQSAREMLEALETAKADLPHWLKIRHQVSGAWQKTVEINNTLKVIAGIIGALLAFGGWILAAEDTTPAGRIREKVITYISGNHDAAITYRSIGETEFVVNDTTVKDITQPHYITDTHQISIGVRVRDTDGETISDDQIACQWTFDPPLQEQAFGEEGECKLSYPTPEDLDNQLVTAVIQGKDGTEITGMSAKSINIILTKH